MNQLISVLASGVTDDNGVPLQNGTVTFYAAETTDLETVYSDFELTEPLANPAPLDAAGRLVAYTDTRLKLVIQNSLGTTIHTWDDVGTSDADINAVIPAAGIPAGLIAPFGGPAAPLGWLLCNGDPFIITAYPALYSVIGTSFNTGGEPAGTARVPALARKTLVGAGGTGTATLGNAVGNSGGEEKHVLVTAELASHAHTDSGHVHQTYDFVGALLTGGDSWNLLVGNTLGTTVATGNGTANIQNTGSDTAHNNIQPSLVVNFIIKY